MPKYEPSWVPATDLIALIKVRWQDRGVTCNDRQWQEFKQKLMPYIGQSGSWQLSKQELSRRVAGLKLLDRDANTIRNYFVAHNPLAKDYVDLIQGICLITARFENSNSVIQTEDIYHLVNHLPGITRTTLREWTGRAQVPILGGRRISLSANSDAVKEMTPQLTVWPASTGQPVQSQRVALIGAMAAERHTQVAIICEQDAVHATFSAVLIEDVSTAPDVARLVATLANIDTGNPSRPVLLLLNINMLDASSDAITALLRLLDAHVPIVASILFVETPEIALALHADSQNFSERTRAAGGSASASSDKAESLDAIVPSDNSALTAEPTPHQTVTLVIRDDPNMASEADKDSTSATSATQDEQKHASSNVLIQAQIQEVVRQLNQRAAMPYLALKQEAIDTLLPVPRLLIAGAYGSGKRTLLLNLVTALNTQPNRSSVIIDCRDPRWQPLLADIANLLTYVLRAGWDAPADVDVDEMTEVITYMLSKGTLVPAFIHTDALSASAASTLATALRNRVKRFYIATTQPEPFVDHSTTLQRLRPPTNTEMYQMAKRLGLNATPEELNALLAATPAWLAATPLGLEVALKDRATAAQKALAYVQRCIDREGSSERSGEIAQFASRLAAFSKFQGDLRGAHHRTWLTFVADADPNSSTDQQMERLQVLLYCGLILMTPKGFMFANPDLELLFATRAWLLMPGHLRADTALAAELLGWVHAWQPQSESIAKLIDNLPLPTSEKNLEPDNTAPIIEFILSVPETILSQCKDLGNRFEKLRAVLQAWCAIPEPTNYRWDIKGMDEHAKRQKSLQLSSVWIERISNHPSLITYQQHLRLAVVRAKALDVIKTCKRDLDTMGGWPSRSRGAPGGWRYQDEFDELGIGDSYGRCRQRIRDACIVFDQQADPEFEKAFDHLLNACALQWPAFILELLAIDSDTAFAAAIALAIREERAPVRDFAEGRLLPLNELRYQPSHPPSLTRLRARIASSNSPETLQDKTELNVCRRLLQDLSIWGA